MAGRLFHCETVVALTDEEFERLEAMPDRGYGTERKPGCELQRGHPGAHCAVGQDAGDDVAWWLLWEGDEAAVAPDRLKFLTYCPAETGPPHEDLCTLPEGHWGAHGFELEWETWSGS
jgi:hypothetical protein